MHIPGYVCKCLLLQGMDHEFVVVQSVTKLSPKKTLSDNKNNQPLKDDKVDATMFPCTQEQERAMHHKTQLFMFRCDGMSDHSI